MSRQRRQLTAPHTPTRVAVLAGVLLATTVLAAACGPPGLRREQVPVRLAYRGPGNLISIDVGTCHGHPTATTTESPTMVRISVRSNVPDEDATDCADDLWVRLQAPLGTRRLVDAHTGKSVGVPARVDQPVPGTSLPASPAPSP